MRERRGRGAAGSIGRLAIVLLATGPIVAACGGRPPGDEGLRIRFEDLAEPGVFERTGSAVRDDPEGAGGLWAAVPGLPRPERAEIVNLDTGDETTVALFRGTTEVIRISNEAADALGIASAPAPVRITALRSVPEIEY